MVRSEECTKIGKKYEKSPLTFKAKLLDLLSSEID